MSVLSCLSGLLQAGVINQAQHDEARSVYEGILNGDEVRGTMDPTMAEAHAARATAKVLSEAAQARKVNLARNVKTYNDLVTNRIHAHPDGPIAGLTAIFDRDLHNRPGDRLNVSSLAEMYKSKIASVMQAVEAYKPTMGGLKQDTFGIRQAIYELFKVDTGNPLAKKAAEGLKAAGDYGVKQAKNFGRAFSSDDEWRISQFWTTDRVAKFGDADFRTTAMKHVDAGGIRIFDPDERINHRSVNGRTVSDPNPTFNKPVEGVRRDFLLQRASKNIREDLNSGPTGVSNVFRPEHRMFRFTDGKAGADAYLEMMDKFGPGQGGYYAMVQQHAEAMGRELGLLHMLGSSPGAMANKLLDAAIERNAAIDAARVEFEKHGTPLPPGINPSPKSIGGAMADKYYRTLGGDNPAFAKRLVDFMLGRLSGAGDRTIGGFFRGLRSLLTGAQLGSATISAVPGDTWMVKMAASFNGLSSGRIVGQIFKDFLRGTDKDLHALAGHLGIVASEGSRIAIGTKQYQDELIGRGVLSRTSDFVMKASRLHHWDATVNSSWTMEFMAALGDRSGKAWGDLEPEFKRFLTNYGFTPDEWSTLSKMEILNFNGAKFAVPDSLEGALRAKLMSAVNDEKQFAYAAGSSNRIRATTATLEAGTFRGELSRSLFMYKTFAMTMINTHGMRAAQELARGGRMAYATELILGMTMMGAISYQAKQVLYGKDPLDMMTPGFWFEAALQGGALGIYGDFLRSATSRTGGDFKDAVFGPMSLPFQMIGEAGSEIVRSFQDGKPINWGRLLANDLKRITPGSTIWYVRLLFDRYVADTISRMLDPSHEKTFRRAQQRAQKLHGQDYYWPPGAPGPARGPDMGAMFH